MTTDTLNKQHKQTHQPPLHLSPSALSIYKLRNLVSYANQFVQTKRQSSKMPKGPISPFSKQWGQVLGENVKCHRPTSFGSEMLSALETFCLRQVHDKISLVRYSNECPHRCISTLQGDTSDIQKKTFSYRNHLGFRLFGPYTSAPTLVTSASFGFFFDHTQPLRIEV